VAEQIALKTHIGSWDYWFNCVSEELDEQEQEGASYLEDSDVSQTDAVAGDFDICASLLRAYEAQIVRRQSWQSWTTWFLDASRELRFIAICLIGEKFLVDYFNPIYVIEATNKHCVRNLIRRT